MLLVLLASSIVAGHGFGGDGWHDLNTELRKNRALGLKYISLEQSYRNHKSYFLHKISKTGLRRLFFSHMCLLIYGLSIS
jgi:hypothetical protein